MSSRVYAKVAGVEILGAGNATSSVSLGNLYCLTGNRVEVPSPKAVALLHLYPDDVHLLHVLPMMLELPEY